MEWIPWWIRRTAVVVPCIRGDSDVVREAYVRSHIDRDAVLLGLDCVGRDNEKLETGWERRGDLVTRDLATDIIPRLPVRRMWTPRC